MGEELLDVPEPGSQIFEELSAIIKDLGGPSKPHFRASPNWTPRGIQFENRRLPEVIFGLILKLFIFPRSQAPRCSDMQ